MADKEIREKVERKRHLVRSCAKGEKVVLGNVQIELTWGPDLGIVKGGN